MNKLIKPLILISQGNQLEDKIKILSYFFKAAASRIAGRRINPILSGNVNIKNNDGIFFCGNHINSVWVASTIHERDIEKYFYLSKGIFMDIGSNIGKYTIKIARELGNKGKVISVEPEPNNFNILKKNITLNNLKNVKPFNLACSSKEGILEFYINSSGTGGHSLLKKTNKKIKVKASTIDKILQSAKIKKIDFLKIDAEGAELDVLRGAEKALSYHPRIIIEIENPENIESANFFLKKFNYKMQKIGKEEYLFR